MIDHGKDSLLLEFVQTATVYAVVIALMKEEFASIEVVREEALNRIYQHDGALQI